MSIEGVGVDWCPLELFVHRSLDNAGHSMAFVGPRGTCQRKTWLPAASSSLGKRLSFMPPFQLMQEFLLTFQNGPVLMALYADRHNVVGRSHCSESLSGAVAWSSVAVSLCCSWWVLLFFLFFTFLSEGNL